MVKGRVADGKAVVMVQTVGTSAAVVVDMMPVGIRQGLWNGPSGARRPGGGRY